MKQLNKEEFECVVMQEGKKVIVSFFTEWGAPCKVMTPVINQVEKEYLKQIEFYKVDIEKEPMLALDYRILSVPTLLFVKDGKIAGKVEEAVTKSVIDTKIKKYFS